MIYKISIVSLLIILLFGGCSNNPAKSDVDNYSLEGIWAEKYTVTKFKEVTYPEDTSRSYDVPTESELIFTSDSFFLTISENDNSVVREDRGEYGIIEDTLFFMITLESGEPYIHKLQFNFISDDSVSFNTISYPASEPDSNGLVVISIGMIGYIWGADNFWNLMFIKNYGTFIRQ